MKYQIYVDNHLCNVFDDKKIMGIPPDIYAQRWAEKMGIPHGGVTTKAVAGT